MLIFDGLTDSFLACSVINSIRLFPFPAFATSSSGGSEAQRQANESSGQAEEREEIEVMVSLIEKLKREAKEKGK